MLSCYENNYFTKILPKYNSVVKRCPTSDPYERELWNIENMIDMDIEDPIKLGKIPIEESKYKYYEHHFGVRDYQDDFKNKMCKEYIKGLLWVSKYYFEKCPSWYWQYPYSHAPFISDLSNYCKKINALNYTFDNKPCISPCVQLLAVLPPACKKLLPKNYQELIVSPDSPIIDFYPIEIYFDMINKDLYWKCIPYIPCIDMDRILECVKDVKLSKDEDIRNKILDDFRNY